MLLLTLWFSMWRSVTKWQIGWIFRFFNWKNRILVALFRSFRHFVTLLSRSSHLFFTVYSIYYKSIKPIFCHCVTKWRDFYSFAPARVGMHIQSAVLWVSNQLRLSISNQLRLSIPISARTCLLIRPGGNVNKIGRADRLTAVKRFS